MVPTTRLRWLVLRNPCTAGDVRAFMKKNNTTTATAMASLSRTTEPVLQQWFAREDWQTDTDLFDSGEWRKVETVTEPHPPL